MARVVRIEWELPDALFAEMLGSEAQAALDAKQALVLDWVRCGRVSLRQGADLLGRSYRDFLAVLTEHRVPTCDYEPGWLDSELGAAPGTDKPDRAP
jgi:predicted HTH domain antitoxin